jgi:hypothetical protein
VEAVDWAFRIITALGGATAITMLFRIRADKKKILAEVHKTDLDAAAVLTATSLSLMVPLQEQVAQLSAEITALRVEVAQLRAVLAEHGIPLPSPPDSPGRIGPPQQFPEGGTP